MEQFDSSVEESSKVKMRFGQRNIGPIFFCHSYDSKCSCQAVTYYLSTHKFNISAGYMFVRRNSKTNINITWQITKIVKYYGKKDTEHFTLAFTDALVRFINSRRLLNSVLSILKRFGFFSTISKHVLSETKQAG